MGYTYTHTHAARTHTHTHTCTHTHTHIVITHFVYFRVCFMTYLMMILINISIAVFTKVTSFSYQENYLGEDSTFTDYEAVDTTKDNSVFEHIDSIATKQDIFDPRAYRPFEVKVEVTLHEIQAHLVKVK